MRKRKKARIGSWLFICSFIFAMLGIHWGISSQAADGQVWIEINNEKVGNEIVMQDSSLVLTMGTQGETYYDRDKYLIEWDITAEQDREIVSFQGSKGDVYNIKEAGAFNCVVKAKKPGNAQVTLRVYDSIAGGGTLTPVAYVSCNIKVVFSIDTSLNSDYQLVYPTDTKKSLIMYTDQTENMKLNIGDAAENTLWQSLNKDVVEVTTTKDQNGKQVVMAKAVGAGVTTIRAEGKEDYGNDEIKVYVCPRVSQNGAANSFNKTGTFSMMSGDWIYTDAVFSENKTLTIKDKMVWVISKYDNSNNKHVIEDSLGNIKSDLIELTPVGVEEQQNLKVVAKAGQYVIDFYPSGAYKDEKEKSEVVPVTTIVLNIYGDFASKEVNLNTGDKFSISDSLNITQEEYLSWFEVTFAPTGYANSISYDTTNGLISANASTKQTPIDVFINVKKGYEDKVKTILSPSMQVGGSLGPFKLTIRVVDELLLDQTSIRLVVGEERQLSPSTATYDGVYEWVSSDEKYVKVSDSGLVQGLAATVEDVTITVSQKLSDGSIKRATCKVRVVATAKDISLNTTDLKLQVSERFTVVASFNPDRSDAPIQWMVSDENIFTINVSTDKKSVVLTAKKPGTAVLTALNEDNYATAVCKVTVLSPITSLSLSDSQMSVKLNREVVRLNATYGPKDATDTELEWQSSDTSVATVDESGLVTLLKAGTTVITVKPVYNVSPPIMAQCLITVIQSSSGLTLEATQLSMDVGESKLLSYILTPAGSTSVVTWESMDSKVATISKTGLISAKKAGKTYIVATSDDGYSATCEVVVSQPATGIKLDVNNLTLGVGDSYSVIATLSPAETTEKMVTWTSQDSKIAKVSSDGKVTGVAAGTTTILAKTRLGEVVYLYVNVYDKVKGLTIEPQAKTITANQSFSLTATFIPVDPSNKKVTWSTSDSSVATVSSSGKVRGVKGGTAMIVCTADDGGYKATCLVTVVEGVTEVKLNKSSCKLSLHQVVNLKATVKSNTATNKKVKWTTSNKKIATVNSSGKVTAKKVGKCTIKATATDGSKEYATCSIQVIRKVSRLKINKSYIRLMEGKSSKIKASVSPSNASKKGLKWSTSDTNVAVVSNSGKVTAISEGTAQIKVSTTDGSKKSVSCTVQVYKRVPTTAITIAQKDVVMVRGTSENVAVTIQPVNTTDKIKYASDNRSVATVSSKGKVTARRPGTATITITTSSGKQASVNITVVGLNKTSITLEQYDKEELWVEEFPTGVKWTSSNPNIARVSNGTVIGTRPGRATIQATIKGVKLYCHVRVIRIK